MILCSRCNLLWKSKASSKKNENTVPIQGGSEAERIFYIITVITAVGEAMGEKRHYNTYYVQIAWEWFLA